MASMIQVAATTVAPVMSRASTYPMMKTSGGVPKMSDGPPFDLLGPFLLNTCANKSCHDSGEVLNPYMAFLIHQRAAPWRHIDGRLEVRGRLDDGGLLNLCMKEGR